MISLTFIRLELLSSLFLVPLDAEFVKAEKIIGFIIVKIKKIIKIITTIILEDKLAYLVRNLHFFQCKEKQNFKKFIIKTIINLVKEHNITFKINFIFSKTFKEKQYFKAVELIIRLDFKVNQNYFKQEIQNFKIKEYINFYLIDNNFFIKEDSLLILELYITFIKVKPFLHYFLITLIIIFLKTLIS